MRQNLHVHYSADLYDHYARHGVEHFDMLTMARVLIEMRARPAGGQMLDIGTGTGVVPIKLAQRAEARRWGIVGADYYEDMLDIARAAARGQPLAAELSFVQDDVHAMRFADESFDIALARSNVHHWADPVQALRETFRVLRPGGVAIVHEPRRDSHPPALEAFNRARAQLGVEDSRGEEKYTLAELQAFIAQAGLAAYSSFTVPATGVASLGVEILVRKPNAASKG